MFIKLAAFVTIQNTLYPIIGVSIYILYTGIHIIKPVQHFQTIKDTYFDII